MKCSACGGELQPTTIVSATGVGGSVIVTLTDVPVLVRADHPEMVQYVDRGFREELNDRVFENAVPFSKPKGLVRKLHHCPSCDAALDVETKMSCRVEGRVTTRKAPPFGIAVDDPAMPCGSCGAAALLFDYRVFDEIAEAIDAAFASVGFSRHRGRL